MSIFQLVTVLIYVTSVLTSSDKQTLNNDRNETNTVLKSLFESSRITIENPTPSTDTRTVNKNASDILTNSTTKNSIWAEGGPMGLHSITPETESSVTEDPHDKDQSSPGLKPSEINIADKQTERIHARKQAIQEETGTIVGRKGVNSSEDIPFKSSTEAHMLNTMKTSTELPAEIKPNSSVIKNDDKSSLTDINLEKKPDTNNTKHVPKVILIDPQNVTVPKRKPTSTTGEGDDDGKGMPSSPTQKEIGMPRKVDYIVPLVITIMATPVLGIAAYVLYTRSRDCWDKRHYRRMDFLVDGMYD